MSQCEPILPIRETRELQKWYTRPGVMQAILPVEELRANGVAHVRVPEAMPDFLHCDMASVWLELTDEHEDAARLICDAYPPRYTSTKTLIEIRLLEWMWRITDDIHVALKPVFPGIRMKPSQLRRIEWEANNWHYDIGVATADTYDIQSSIGPADRTADRLGPSGLLATMPFPINTQGPTVVVPWAGEYAGQAVQPPMGYATIFYLHLAWHRGDRWAGTHRGLYFTGFEEGE